MEIYCAPAPLLGEVKISLRCSLGSKCLLHSELVTWNGNTCNLPDVNNSKSKGHEVWPVDLMIMILA